MKSIRNVQLPSSYIKTTEKGDTYLVKVISVLDHYFQNKIKSKINANQIQIEEAVLRRDTDLQTFLDFGKLEDHEQIRRLVVTLSSYESDNDILHFGELNDENKPHGRGVRFAKTGYFIRIGRWKNGIAADEAVGNWIYIWPQEEFYKYKGGWYRSPTICGTIEGFHA